MGRSVNKVTLIGTLGRDPEVRFLPNGNAVANVNIATDESYNDKATGQKVEQTEWHRVTVYGKLAEICQQYLKKGSKAYFEGKLRTREWEKDGVKRYTTEIIANDMMMLDGRSDGMGSGAPMGSSPGQIANNMDMQTANNMGMQNPAGGQNGYSQPNQGGYNSAPQPAAQPNQGYPGQSPQGQPNQGQSNSNGYQQAPQQNQQQAQQQAQQPNYQQPNQGGYQQAPRQAPQQQPQQPVPQPSNSFDDFDDDIPF